ncbi:MAG: FkbM family methyltransferase [Cytophagia bacterium]|nr:FkbM family methyltransferase [Cytophagia bacterium]
MIAYIKRKLQKIQQRKQFAEYGYNVVQFPIEGLGTIDYAQWLHPFDKSKEVTKSNVDFYRHLVSEGSMIIDIGAYIGDTTVPMALAVGKNGLVLGLEPNKYAFKILEKNASLNKGLTNIVPLCFAATDKDGEFEFNYSDASFCNGGFLSQIEQQNHHHIYKLKVTGKNLVNYLHQNHAQDLVKLALVKVDAEGYDKEIIKSISPILSEFKPKLMVECYKKLTTTERNELFDVMDNLGYNVYYLENFNDDGQRIKIERSNMNDHRHFEMLAIHKSKIE